MRKVAHSADATRIPLSWLDDAMRDGSLPEIVQGVVNWDEMGGFVRVPVRVTVP